jgi:hypothetical protein
LDLDRDVRWLCSQPMGALKDDQRRHTEDGNGEKFAHPH